MVFLLVGSQGSGRRRGERFPFHPDVALAGMFWLVGSINQCLPNFSRCIQSIRLYSIKIDFLVSNSVRSNVSPTSLDRLGSRWFF